MFVRWMLWELHPLEFSIFFNVLHGILHRFNLRKIYNRRAAPNLPGSFKKNTIVKLQTKVKIYN